MTPDQLADAIEDIWTEPWKDPSLFPDCLNHVVAELGVIATGGVLEVDRPGVNPSGFAIDCEDSPIQKWADGLLRRLQERAVRGVPLGETEEVWGDLGPANPKDV